MMLLTTLQKFFFLLLLIQVMMMNFAQHTKANVIRDCANHTTCIETYAEVYSALASPENYFNIALALYPARKPSSVLVHVNLHTLNQTEKSSPVPYTWSMSCLYAAFPAEVLEFLSLGSILVKSRKRKLNITIAPFCCNVSEDDRFIIIDRVLAELQDLAVSPGVQDPTLNTAECVIEGHKTDISATATEHGPYIRIMLWCSFCFTIIFGPSMAIITFVLFDIYESDKTENKEKKKNLAKAVKGVACFLSIVESALLFTIVGYSICGKAPWDLYVILGVIFVEAVVVGLIVRKNCSDSFIPGNTTVKEVLGIFLWANLTMYYFCWLVIGIMVNPLWGITVLLVISVVIAATVYPVYILLRGYDHLIFILCGLIWCSTLLLVTLVVLAGQSFFIRETANDVVKTALLYVTTALVAWIIPEVKKEKFEKSKTTKGEEKESTPLSDM